MIRLILFFAGIAAMFVGNNTLFWGGLILAALMFLSFFVHSSGEGMDDTDTLDPVEIARNAKYNRNLKRMGIVDDSHIVETTIGWRKDPINKEDGQTEVKPLDDGTPVYQRTIRRGKRKN